jgi:hypothetical protein
MTTTCPVTARCSMHANAEAWLASGDIDALNAQMDVFWILRRRAWRDCTCDLFRRIVIATGQKPRAF